MKLITRNTDYALRALCYIAKRKSIVTVDELVAKLGVPRPFMRKILQCLNKKGILVSCKGQGGGFRLKAGSGKVSVIEIMRVFQGNIQLNGCFLKKDVCPNRPKCALRKHLRSIEQEVLRRLKAITIGSLI
jgi:Rrf2 family protein